MTVVLYYFLKLNLKMIANEEKAPLISLLLKKPPSPAHVRVCECLLMEEDKRRRRMPHTSPRIAVGLLQSPPAHVRVCEYLTEFLLKSA